MSDRADFEEWVKSRGAERMLDKYPSGNYSSQQMNLRWEGWQAARAQGGQAVAAVNKSSVGEYEFYPASGLVDMPNGIHKLYAQPQSAVPDVLYDGYTVYQALTYAAKRRTSPENVSDTLDAVVSVIKRPQPQQEGE